MRHRRLSQAVCGDRGEGLRGLHPRLAAPHQSRRCLVPPTVKTASGLPLERSQPTWSEVRLTRTSSPSQWSCCFWLERERRNTRRGRSRRRCLPRGPSARISFAPAVSPSALVIRRTTSRPTGDKALKRSLSRAERKVRIRLPPAGNPLQTPLARAECASASAGSSAIARRGVPSARG